MAAEFGTKKVITEHSTIGLVITTDGSISEIPRSEYAEAEERVINELISIDKPFIVLVNSMYPESDEAKAVAREISEKYNVAAKTVNCLELSEDDIRDILSELLYEFPVREIKIHLPMWITALDGEHWLQKQLYSAVMTAAADIKRVADINGFVKRLCDCENIDHTSVLNVDLGSGSACVSASCSTMCSKSQPE